MLDFSTKRSSPPILLVATNILGPVISQIVGLLLYLKKNKSGRFRSKIPTDSLRHD